MSDPSTAPPPVSVLVIEDVADTADSLARFLHLGSGDVVVCDVGLPRLNGLRVAEELTELKPRPLLIAVTAYGGVYTEDLTRAAGFDHYLVKPADPLEIERLIREHARK
jgi:CheY-like chemotaxis protein